MSSLLAVINGWDCDCAQCCFRLSYSEVPCNSNCCVTTFGLYRSHQTDTHRQRGCSLHHYSPHHIPLCQHGSKWCFADCSLPHMGGSLVLRGVMILHSYCFWNCVPSVIQDDRVILELFSQSLSSVITAVVQMFAITPAVSQRHTVFLFYRQW